MRDLPLQFLTDVKMGDAEDDIAVIGIGCNFPGGEGLENFWKVLLEGKNCAVPIPNERFDCSQWYDPDNKVGKSCTAKAALIDGFNEFDHKLFGITESEVEQMDPQQKYLLQCTYRALENAGIPMEKASGTRTGVYLGLMNRDYEQAAGGVCPNIINHWTGTGLAMSIAANRVSYVFNRGTLLYFTFLYSSGDCEMALCGGVSCIIQPTVFVALSMAKMISPEGTSKPFSSRADGYGRGEGCGVLLLKPLKKALKENDNIWGIITKTAVNQDGHTVSPITKPSMVQQEDLLRRIYSESDLSAVQYIEAHGTGTPVGDPIEAGSISKVIAKARPPGLETLCIGSVKGNIGHTESAAGVAGLIKLSLAMSHRQTMQQPIHSWTRSVIIDGTVD
ncbi:highly reducing polyketide synthase 40-like [Esox lucius]|uniref:highly reducing polyketide synthase 40-like n=1 Tax=Esox lucius TaxID=8010 RepID=UPI00147776E2|nr:highly reducing polyketide synthase 40-like [Esox lucius]